MQNVVHEADYCTSGKQIHQILCELMYGMLIPAIKAKCHKDVYCYWYNNKVMS